MEFFFEILAGGAPIRKGHVMRQCSRTLISAVLGLLIPGMMPAWMYAGEQRPRELLVEQLPSKSKRFAIVIGVDRYDDPQINGLQGAVNDAKALVAALTQTAGFPEEQVIRLSNDRMNSLRIASQREAIF